MATTSGSRPAGAAAASMNPRSACPEVMSATTLSAFSTRSSTFTGVSPQRSEPAGQEVLGHGQAGGNAERTSLHDPEIPDGLSQLRGVGSFLVVLAACLLVGVSLLNSVGCAIIPAIQGSWFYGAPSTSSEPTTRTRFGGRRSPSLPLRRPSQPALASRPRPSSVRRTGPLRCGARAGTLPVAGRSPPVRR